MTQRFSPGNRWHGYRWLWTFTAAVSLTGCYRSAPIDGDDTETQPNESTDSQTFDDNTKLSSDIESVLNCGTQNIFARWRWTRDVIEEQQIVITSKDLGATHYIQFTPMPDHDYLAGSYTITSNNAVEFSGYFGFTTGEWDDQIYPILLMWEENELTADDETDASISDASYTAEAVPIDVPDCDTLILFYYTGTDFGEETIVASEYVKVK